MRRFFLLAVLALFALPAAVFAQDGKSLWDLTKLFTVQDLGFQFNYPDGWVFSADNGIVLAENQADIDAQQDGDDSTNPEGYTIGILGASLEAIGVEPDAKLEDVVDAVLKLAQITEQDRTELAVMSRRSISIFGVNKVGRPGIGTIWTQDGFVVVMNIGGAEASSDLAYSWGQILGSVTPVGALEFGDTLLDSPNGDFTMSYPKDWFTSKDQPGAVAEVEADLSSNGDPTGIGIAMFQAKLSDVGAKVTDLASLQELVKTNQKWDDSIIPTEHIILGQPAFTFAGANEGMPGGWGAVTAFILNDDTAVIIGAVSPSEEKFKEMWPTYLAMLNSIKTTDKAS